MARAWLDTDVVPAVATYSWPEFPALPLTSKGDENMGAGPYMALAPSLSVAETLSPEAGNVTEGLAGEGSPGQGRCCRSDP